MGLRTVRDDGVTTLLARRGVADASGQTPTCGVGAKSGDGVTRRPAVETGYLLAA